MSFTRVLPEDSVLDSWLLEGLTTAEILRRAGGGDIRTISRRRKALGLHIRGKRPIAELLREGRSAQEIFLLGYALNSIRMALKRMTAEAEREAARRARSPLRRYERAEPDSGLTLAPLRAPTLAQLMAGR